MSFTWLTLALQNNQEGNFTFTDRVAAYAVGISYFSLTFPLTDNQSFNVQSMGITLQDQQTDVSTIKVKPTFTLQDGGNNSFDPAVSMVYVTVLAWLGAGTGIFLSKSPELINGSQPVSPGGDPAVFATGMLQSFQSGFNGGESVLEMSASVAASNQGVNGLSVSGILTLTSGSGPAATNNKLIAGLLAVSDPKLPLEIQTVQYDALANGAGSQTALFNNEVESAIALISFFDFKFKNSTAMTGLYGGVVINSPYPGNPGPLLPQITVNPGNKKEVKVNAQGFAFDYAGGTAIASSSLILTIIANTSA